ncbi:MAG: hypothetical protein IJF71_02495 [Clostridia bacterium]|nr:hypothetical protein [Clostridia bacterium]
MMRQSYKIALGGITAALMLVFLFGAYYSPTARLSFYVLSGAMLYVPLSKRLYGVAALCYIGVAIIGALLRPISVLPLLATAAHPFLVALFLYKKTHIAVEYAVKLLAFEAMVVLAYLLMPQLLGENLVTQIPLWLYMVAGGLLFLVYDVLIVRIVGRLEGYLDRFLPKR